MSFDKLKSQRFDFMCDIACFSQPSDVVPFGLTNDRDTIPIPTLIIRERNDDGIVISKQNILKNILANDDFISR